MDFLKKDIEMYSTENEVKYVTAERSIITLRIRSTDIWQLLLEIYILINLMTFL